MLKLDELKNHMELLDSVEWDLNPAVAVGRHLEWGAGWACDSYRSRGSAEESVYFAISTWEPRPVVVLVKRNGFDMEELASFQMPEHLEKKFLDSIGHHKGVYELETDVKNWLKNKLNIH